MKGPGCLEKWWKMDVEATQLVSLWWPKSYPWCATMVVSQREGQKNIRIVCHIFKTRPEAQWNAVKNKYTVAWHPELNLQQADITRYSNDSLINALAMGQLVAFFNAQPKMYLQQAVGHFLSCDIRRNSCIWSFIFPLIGSQIYNLQKLPPFPTMLRPPVSLGCRDAGTEFGVCIHLTSRSWFVKFRVFTDISWHDMTRWEVPYHDISWEV